MTTALRIRKIDVILVGACGIVTQTVFLREMLGMFRGTEFVIGIIIASWMMWVGTGAVLGGRVSGFLFLRRFRNFQYLIISAAFLLPLTIIMIRAGRGYLPGTPGEYPPMGSSILFCILVMAPAAFTSGLLYNEASRWWIKSGDSISTGVSRVYILEAAGSLGGGIIFSLILLRLLTHMEIALLVFAVIASVVVRPDFRKPFHLILTLVFLAAAVPLGGILDDISIERLFPGYRVADFASSRYGEIAVVKRGGNISCYSGGSRLFTIPGTERAEEMIHIPLISHGKPQNVLVVGGGLKEERDELLKHPSVERADFVQIDEKLIEMMREYYIQNDNEGPETELIIEDGRRYLRDTETGYDVVIVNAPDPVNIELNRYYTEEFFRWARRILRKGGILALNHTSSENYISVPQGRVLRCIDRTLRQIFGEVTLVPGSTVFFLAGDKKVLPEEMLNHLSERGIETDYISNYLPYRLSGERIRFTEAAMERSGAAEINRDLTPVLTSYELLLEFHRAGHDADGLAGFLLSGLSRWIYLAAGLVIVALFIISGRKLAARLDIWTVGLTGFLLQISILLAYQSFSGYLYEGIIILTASFMAGISAGTLYAGRSDRAVWKSGAILHLILVILALLHYGWARMITEAGAGITPGTAGFIIFSFLTGFLTGLFYRAVVSSVLEPAGGEQPAVFYAWDMFGACLGSIIGGVLIFPVHGVMGATAVILFLHTAGLLLSRKWRGGQLQL
jgi:spermidine synthase